MVYTVTFNPAIDYVVHTGEMKLGSTNRSDREEMYFGGKGINVSIVLRELDIQSKALGFTAGFTGEAIENGLAEMGIDTDFVHLKKGNSRINVKIKSAEETELNGQGPDIDDEAVNKLFAKLDKLQDGDTLILAGSIPAIEISTFTAPISFSLRAYFSISSSLVSVTPNISPSSWLLGLIRKGLYLSTLRSRSFVASTTVLIFLCASLSSIFS